MTAPTYFTLTGSWVPDTNKGYISGTASIQMLVGSGDVLPTSLGGVIVPHLIPAKIINGTLCDQTGRPGVSLIANTPELNLSTSLYYTVVFSLTYYPAAGIQQSLNIHAVTFTAPTSATTVDLGSVTPAAGVEAAQIASVGSANITDATTIGRQILTAANAAAALSALGAAAVPSAGIVKSTGTALTPAVSGTDYAPPTTGSGLLKGNGSGGFSSAAAGTDYAPATTGSSLLKASSGGFANAVSGTDYAPPTTGSSLLKGNSAGGFASATSGTDYAPPTSGSSLLKGNGSGGFSAATSGTDYAPATTGSSLLKANGSGGFSAASSTSDYVPWSAGTGGILPATSGQHLTTQGGVTLDDGTGKVAIPGGTLDAVTIGSTTPAPSITATALQAPSSLTAGSQGAWINQHATLSGTTTSTTSCANFFSINDQVVNNSGAGLGLLSVVDFVSSPATGGRIAIWGQTVVSSTGTLTTSTGFTGIAGRAITSANLGGTSGTPMGSLWGGWFTCNTGGGTYHNSIMGVEIDVNCQSNSIQQKIGARICLGTGDVANDTVRGTKDDTALNIIQNTGATSWGIGIKFGTDQSAPAAAISGSWPFNNTSTIIGTSAVGNGLPANNGIDFSLIAFTGSAFITGPAPITMAKMASPPSNPPSGSLAIYVASDGMHILNHNGDDILFADITVP